MNVFRHLISGEIQTQDIPSKPLGGKRRNITQFEPSIGKILTVTEQLGALCASIQETASRDKWVQELMRQCVEFCLKKIHNERYDNFTANNKLLDSLTVEEICGSWNETDLVGFVDDSLSFYFGDENRWFHNILHNTMKKESEKGFTKKFYQRTEELKYQFTIIMTRGGLTLDQIEGLRMSFIQDMLLYMNDYEYRIRGLKKAGPDKKVHRVESMVLKDRMRHAGNENGDIPTQFYYDRGLTDEQIQGIKEAAKMRVNKVAHSAIKKVENINKERNNENEN